MTSSKGNQCWISKLDFKPQPGTPISCAQTCPCDNLTNCPGHLEGIRGILVSIGHENPDAGVAQSVEHLICNQRVRGSNPFASSRVKLRTRASQNGAGQAAERQAAAGFFQSTSFGTVPACSDLRAECRERDPWFS